MRESSKTTRVSPEAAFSHQVGAGEIRKLRARRRGTQGIWFGLGMFGLVGWAVALPAFLGALLGVYIDKHYPGVHSWTLSLLIVGLFIGCLNAWHWVAREDKAIRDDAEKKDE